MQDHRFLVALALIVAMSDVSSMAPQAPSRDGASRPAGSATISGRVVDAVTGAPIARARVELAIVARAADRPRSVFTDDDGVFAFEDLAAGAYTLGAERSTYQPARYPPAGRTLRSTFHVLSVAKGQTVSGVVVGLTRGSAIAGRIVDRYGEPMERAEVRLLTARDVPSGLQSVVRPQTETNDLGEFRFPRVPPGEYFIAARARDRDAEAAVSTRMRLTYYPGVTDVRQAAPIKVESGLNVPAVDFQLVDGPYTTVTGVVLNPSGRPRLSGAYVSVRRIDAAGVPGLVEEGTGLVGDGTFSLQLEPGDYQFEVLGVRPDTAGESQEIEWFGVARASVGNEPESTVTIRLGIGARVSGRVTFDGASPPPKLSDLRVTLVAGGAICRSGRSDMAADGTFTIDGVVGTCALRLRGAAGRWVPSSVTHAGRDLGLDALILDPGVHLTDVAVVLTDRRTELAMRVLDDRGADTREYVAVAFPVERDDWTPRSRRVRPHVPLPGNLFFGAPATDFPLGPPRVNPAGRPNDTITGLPEGDYFVIAVDDLSADQLRDPDVLASFVPRANRVALTAGRPVDVTLRRIPFSSLGQQ